MSNPWDTPEHRAFGARLDIETAMAHGHQVSICGGTTGHTAKTIIMCDSAERAALVAESLRAYADEAMRAYGVSTTAT